MLSSSPCPGGVLDLGLLGPVGWGRTEMNTSPKPVAQQLSTGPAVGLSTGVVVGKGGWRALDAVWSRLRRWWERWPRNWFGSFGTLPFGLSGLQRAPAQSHTCKHTPREPLGQGGAPCPKSRNPLPCFCSLLSSLEAPCCTHRCPVLGGGLNGPHWAGRISQRGTVVGPQRAFGTTVEVAGTRGPAEPH